MISTCSTRNNNVAILISPGFAESDVVYCLSQMRGAGLPVSIIGVSKKSISSQHGLMVYPDYVLHEMEIDERFQLLIIPGSYECVTNLLTSPDFHDQINEYRNHDGLVIILKEAQAALEQANLFQTNDRILRQADQPLERFCQQLIKLVKTA